MLLKNRVEYIFSIYRPDDQTLLDNRDGLYTVVRTTYDKIHYLEPLLY